MTALTGNDLLDWNENTAQTWQRLLRAHPEALTLPCDIRETRNVGELLQHIVAVELRYAERLHGLPETAYEAVPFGTADELFATHDRAMGLLTQLQENEQEFWAQEIQFATRRGGTVRATRRTVLVHTLMHSIRHYAQLATLVRQHGIRPDAPMDFLFLHAREVTPPA